VSVNIYDSFDVWDQNKWDIKLNGGGRVTITVENGKLVYRDTSTNTVPATSIIRSKQYFTLTKDKAKEIRVDVELPSPSGSFIAQNAFFVITPSSVTDTWAQDMYQISFENISGQYRVGVSAMKNGQTVFSCEYKTVEKNYATLRYVVEDDTIVFYVDNVEICRDKYRLESREIAVWLETIMSGGCVVYWDNVATVGPSIIEEFFTFLGGLLRQIVDLLMQLMPVIIIIGIIGAVAGAFTIKKKKKKE